MVEVPLVAQAVIPLVQLLAPNQPVVGISYYEAEAFCRWLSQKHSRTYRLPTEEEWQRLAQGDEANDTLPSDARAYPWATSGKQTSPTPMKVASESPAPWESFPSHKNPTGTHDCAGNVWEWCASWYAERQTRRVLRGGSWNSDRKKQSPQRLSLLERPRCP